LRFVCRAEFERRLVIPNKHKKKNSTVSALEY